MRTVAVPTQCLVRYTTAFPEIQVSSLAFSLLPPHSRFTNEISQIHNWYASHTIDKHCEQQWGIATIALHIGCYHIRGPSPKMEISPSVLFGPRWKCSWRWPFICCWKLLRKRFYATNHRVHTFVLEKNIDTMNTRHTLYLKNVPPWHRGIVNFERETVPFLLTRTSVERHIDREFPLLLPIVNMNESNL